MTVPLFFIMIGYRIFRSNIYIVEFMFTHWHQYIIIHILTTQVDLTSIIVVVDPNVIALLNSCADDEELVHEVKWYT